MYSHNNLGRPLIDVIDIMVGDGANIPLAIIQTKRTVHKNRKSRKLKLQKIKLKKYENKKRICK